MFAHCMESVSAGANAAAWVVAIPDAVGEN